MDSQFTSNFDGPSQATLKAGYDAVNGNQLMLGPYADDAPPVRFGLRGLLIDRDGEGEVLRMEAVWRAEPDDVKDE